MSSDTSCDGYLQRMKSRTGDILIESLVTPDVGRTFSTTLDSVESKS